jgi:hypothetical protein
VPLFLLSLVVIELGINPDSLVVFAVMAAMKKLFLPMNVFSVMKRKSVDEGDFYRPYILP